MAVPGSNHPGDQILRAYGAGELHGPLADSVHSHLEFCTSCRQRVAGLSADTFLNRLRDAHVKSESPILAGPSLAGISEVSNPPPSSSISTPTSLPPGLADHPDYELLGELGHGGMGVVYLVHNKLMARKEVLKVVNRELLDRRGVLDRFLREIRNAAQLHHTNIVTGYSAIRVGETFAFAMEHVEGQDLAGYVKRHGPLPVAHACYFIYQAALGLQYAHEKGMVHRDIKPGNLILARQGRRAVVKVLDFGLAKASREEPIDKGLTHEGQMLGTPDYIAPEQSLDAAKADIRADIYSLGCTLYYLLTGGPPFPGPSLYEVLQAHQSIDAKPLHLMRTDVSPALGAVVDKMMAKDPQRRYQTPIEVARTIKPFFKSAESGTSPTLSLASREISPAAGNADPSPRADLQIASDGRPPVPQHPTDQTRADHDWALPIQIPERAPVPPLAKSSAGHQSWLRTIAPWSATALVLLTGLALAWVARTLDVTTGDATHVVEKLPPNAVLKTDGQKNRLESPRKPLPSITSSSSSLNPAVLPPSLPSSSPPPSMPSTTARKPSPSVAEKARPFERSASAWNSQFTGMTFVRIPGGEFLMGSADGDAEANGDEKPQHRVRVSPFHLGTTEVTQAQFSAVMGYNPSQFSSTGPGKRKMADQVTDRHPVVNLSWVDAIRFCNAMSRRDHLTPYYAESGRGQLPPQQVRILSVSGTGYRLPTEAEWEYACRAGSTTRYSRGDDPSEFEGDAWYQRNSGSMTHPVALKRSNALGLYDMHGNVAEWCWDWHLVDYYRDSILVDPRGPVQATTRVCRGGSWTSDHRGCRSAARDYKAPVRRENNLGFRVARNVPDL
jgi:formylglycine-generating enzyme required for sulfatase activity/tRNA A-37 threonylcarbamoyl transferase component Bud32